MVFEGNSTTQAERSGELTNKAIRKHFQAIFVEATQCNFCTCGAEVATSCDFISILVQMVSARLSVLLFKSETATQSHRVS